MRGEDVGKNGDVRGVGFLKVDDIKGGERGLEVEGFERVFPSGLHPSCVERCNRDRHLPHLPELCCLIPSSHELSWSPK
jgi:hypothetical protein